MILFIITSNNISLNLLIIFISYFIFTSLVFLYYIIKKQINHNLFIKKQIYLIFYCNFNADLLTFHLLKFCFF